jgi:hypothetical protein
MSTGQQTHAERRRINLRDLPYGLGYVIAAMVMLCVILVAWHVSRGSETPEWFQRYVIPALYWSSPVLVFFAIFFRIGRRRRARRNDSGER